MLTRRENVKRQFFRHEPICQSPEHNPPYTEWEPGEYEWTCDTCGLVQRWIVPKVESA